MPKKLCNTISDDFANPLNYYSCYYYKVNIFTITTTTTKTINSVGGAQRCVFEAMSVGGYLIVKHIENER